MKCPICFNETFEQKTVLKKRLIDEWELSPFETNYIDKQQGFHCTRCSSNLRIMTLAQTIMNQINYNGSFIALPYSIKVRRLKLLEINQVGNLHSIFKKFKKYVFAEYPQIDMQNMPYDDESFDLIVHSDSLEHVKDSLQGLRECYRILKNGGFLLYTIPIIYGRATRKRHSLPASFHGLQDERQGEDYKVWTEYGSDFWVEIIQAGFTDISLFTFGDLSSIGISAKKTIKPEKRYTKFSKFLTNYNIRKDKLKKSVKNRKWGRILLFLYLKIHNK